MKFFTILALLATSTLAIGQSTYWQQEVNYTIEVELDDEKHMLNGFESFEYVNNSPDVLPRIYVHLWPNAYKNGSTALANQQYQQGEDILVYGKDEDKGFIDSLSFEVNGTKANWYFDENHIDICIVELSTPLQPGEKTTISTPFRVKLPSGEISRLGHIGQSYQITQWYPKPAVYDKNGWHQMPYLNQGEFYSEYGSFDVSITLPKNYVVGATGDLQTESEIDFLNERASKTQEAIDQKKFYYDPYNLEDPNDFPISETSTKTIRYTQKNVHDFAWFADKRYSVLKSEVKLPHSGRKVTSWAMYTANESALWSNASEYLNDAIYYYSLWNGDYPYNQVTAVDGTISAGGGMEYPNVTVIGHSGSAHSLEVVIVHEVGHNWFYGQLGTNERVHGWMDEGMNTLNEVRYVQTKYPENTALSDMVLNGSFHFDDLDHHDSGDIGYRMLAWMGEEQPIETHSEEYTPINYGVIMYQKTGLVFFYLRQYLGDDLFDKCMRAYYAEWEFKHPQPEDMRRSIEKTSGKDLEWLFGDLIQTTNHIDYKIKKVKKRGDTYEVTVKNVGQVDGPIIVDALSDTHEVAERKIVEPGQKKTTLTFDQPTIERITIDAYRDIPEVNRQNNTWTPNKLFKKVEPVKWEFLMGDNEAENTNVFWTPTISGNFYDKLMLGVAAHNYGVPFSKFGYLVAPSYSFGRQMVSGISEFSYTMLPKRTFKQSRLGLSIASFKHDTTYRRNESYYISIAPYWMAKIGKRKGGPISQNIRLQSIYKKDVFGPTHVEHAGAYIQYDFNYGVKDHKVNVQLRNDYYTNVNTTDEMARVMLSSTYRLRYLRNKMNRWIEIRGFIGQQYIRNYDNANSYQYSMSLAGTDGTQDLFVDQFYFGRRNLDGMWSQQREENMGGFKSTSYYGTTSYALAAGNLYMDLPIRPGIFGVFADYGTFHNGVTWNQAINTGIGVRLGKVFGVYFPVWMSKELDDSFNGASYGERIRFTLKMNFINKPFDLSNFF